ncbi:MAG: MarR family winged helix-turn-helix transcriptional regulator [Lachnospiraceae bacterium]
MDINATMNDLLINLFRNINTIEEQAMKKEEYNNITVSEMHVIEAIGIGNPKNMTSVAKALAVTTGTLTIAINSLVKKGMVNRVRSEEDRRVVLISLTSEGKKAYTHHQAFHKNLIEQMSVGLTEEEKHVLNRSLQNLSNFFQSYKV